MTELDDQEEALLTTWLSMRPWERLQANEAMLQAERWAQRAKIIERRGKVPDPYEGSESDL